MLHVFVHMIGQDSALLYCSTVVQATMAFNCEMTHRGAQLTQTCLCICICTLVFLYSVFCICALLHSKTVVGFNCGTGGAGSRPLARVPAISVSREISLGGKRFPGKKQDFPGQRITAMWKKSFSLTGFSCETCVTLLKIPNIGTCFKEAFQKLPCIYAARADVVRERRKEWSPCFSLSSLLPWR